MTIIATQRTDAELAARLVTISEQIDRLTQEKQQIQDEIRERHPYGSTPAGDWEIQVQRNRRLDTARIEQRYPVAQYPHLYRPAVNTAALKENLAPVELEQFYSEGTPKVLVR